MIRTGRKILQNSPWLKTLAGNSGWMMLAQGARIFDVMIRSIIIARLLSLAEFGIYAIIMAFVGLLTEIIHLNFGPIILTYGPRYERDEKANALRALLKAGYVVTVLVGVVAVLVIAGVLHFSYDSIIKEPGLGSSILLLAAVTAFGCLDGINKSILRLFDKFRLSCLMDAVCVIVNIALVIAVFTTMDDTINTAVIATAVCLFSLNVIGLIVTFTVLSRVAPGWWRAPLSALREDRRDIIKLAFSNSIAQSIQRTMRKGDVVLLSLMAPPAAVGLYDIAKKLAAMILLARDAIAMAAFPQISRAITSGQAQRLKSLILRLFAFAVPLSLLVLIALYLLGPILITVLYGEKYSPAAPILVLLAVTSLFYTLFFWANALMLNANRAQAIVFTNLGGLIAMGLASIVLVPEFQAVGMALSVIIGVATQFGAISLVSLKAIQALSPNHPKEAGAADER